MKSREQLLAAIKWPLAARVTDAWDESDTNKTATGTGKSYWFTLEKGLQFEDCHQIHVGSLKEAREKIGEATACDCNECASAFGDES